ncbi:hypothetical protein DFP72DRAFT_87603 [Ephemerocybe angulata]|uniref:Uncharacterized protein n=1 Tax=Ephemerocybe angulata TaxID=980116 RepID=A0A8H6HC04_9AGAR|nr:hypothetical protein DFP72DRAFT_87603 [Tulosesus angulatus]
MSLSNEATEDQQCVPEAEPANPSSNEPVDAPPAPIPSITTTQSIPPSNSSPSTAQNPATTPRPVATMLNGKLSVPLSLLFLYPTSGALIPWEGAEMYWRGGISSLATESRAQEELTNVLMTGNDVGVEAAGSNDVELV